MSRKKAPPAAPLTESSAKSTGPDPPHGPKRHDDKSSEDTYANDWRIMLLRNHAGRSPEEREYIIRTALLMEHIAIALRAFEGNLPSTEPPIRDDGERLKTLFRPFIDQVWKESHHGEPARVTAMAICHALHQSRSVHDVIPLLELRGYVKLASTLDIEKVTRVYNAWLDRKPGKKADHDGKFTEIARLVRPLGLKIAAATIERLWRDDQGTVTRKKRPTNR